MQTNRRNFLKTMGIANVCACTGLAGLNGCKMIKGSAEGPLAIYPIEAMNNKLIVTLE